jgi:recombination protein RecA
MTVISREQIHLYEAIIRIQRRFGSHVLVRGAADPWLATAHIPTGLPALDAALGGKGLPRGRICLVSGGTERGMQALALRCLSQAQQVGQVAYVDCPHQLAPDYARRCGLDLSRLVIGRPHDALEALRAIETLSGGRGYAALVLDTTDPVWSDPAAPRHLYELLGRLPALLARGRTVLVATGNAVSAAQRWPDPGPTTPISILGRQASIQMQVVRERWRRQGDQVYAYQARLRVIRNRFGPRGHSVPVSIALVGEALQGRA